MKKRSFVLFIDESGDFKSSPTEKSIAGGQKARNQIVGFMVPDDETFSDDSAKNLLQVAYASCGMTFDKESHAMNHNNAVVNALASSLLSQLPETNIQPVRIANREQLDFGGHDTTYTQMVAELMVRIFAQKSRESVGRISLRLHGANVVRLVNGQKVMRQNGMTETIQASEYEQRIRESLAFITVRLGWSEKAREWEFSGVQLSPAKRVFSLQVCDLLSNASVDRFARIVDSTRVVFKELLGAYDFTLKTFPLLDRIDDYLESGEPAFALRLIAEESVRHELSSAFRLEMDKRRASALDLLISLPIPQRRPQTDLLVGWLTQLERQRFLDLGEQVAQWLLEYVVYPSRERASQDREEIDAFEYGVRRWQLKLLTHLGKLKEARDASDRLDELASSIAGKLDAIPLLLDGQVAQAVHLIDSLEFEIAVARLKDTDTIHADALALFGKIFGHEIHSESRGKTLSTWSQAEAHASRGSDRSRLMKARELNELALTHFSSPKDISQILQYRCHNNALLGDYASARSDLALAINAPDSSHQAIGTTISGPSFELMHWWHLGACVLKTDPDSDESRQFIEAYKLSPLARGNWDDEQYCEYPAHGLLRQAASICASSKESEDTMELLRRLGSIASPGQRPILGAIYLAAMLESAYLLWNVDRRSARLILGESPNQYTGLLSGIRRCAPAFHQFPALQHWLNSAEKTARDSLAGSGNIHKLLDESNVIGY